MIDVVVSGILFGLVYALIAVGFSLIFSVTKFLHLAHGALVIVGAFVSYALIAAGFSFLVALVVTILIAGLLGWWMEGVIFRPLREVHAANASFVVASLAVLLLVQGLVVLLAGSVERAYNLASLVSVFGVSSLQLVVLVVAAVVLGVVWFVLQFSRVGVGVRAVADNAVVASTVGVSVRKYLVGVFVVGSVLAGIAGSLWGLLDLVSPFDGVLFFVKGLVVAFVVGSLRVPLLILAGMVLGVLEVVGLVFFPVFWIEVLLFVLVVVFLFVPRRVVQ